MITGIDLNQTVDYVCKNDKVNPTVWKLGVMSSYVAAQLAQQADNNEHIDGMIKIFRVCVKGWENFNIEYKTEKCVIFGQAQEVIPHSIMDRIPMPVIMEIATKVLEISNLSDEERKN